MVLSPRETAFKISSERKTEASSLGSSETMFPASLNQPPFHEGFEQALFYTECAPIELWGQVLKIFLPSTPEPRVSGKKLLQDTIVR
jgi:hypothetical protein